MCRGVLAVPADRARRDADPRAVDEDAQRAEPGRGVDGGDHLGFVADVGPGEEPADLLRHHRAALLVEVEDDDARAAGGEQPGRRLPEPRCPAGDERRCAGDVHSLTSRVVEGPFWRTPWRQE